MAGGPGFEPGLPGPEPGVLPLNYPPSQTLVKVTYYDLIVKRVIRSNALCFEDIRTKNV